MQSHENTEDTVQRTRKKVLTFLRKHKSIKVEGILTKIATLEASQLWVSELLLNHSTQSKMIIHYALKNVLKVN